MVEAKLRFEQDLYGKAGWYGKPRAFYVGLGAGYFRSRNQALDFDQYPSQHTSPRCCYILRLQCCQFARSANNWQTLGKIISSFPGLILPPSGDG